MKKLVVIVCTAGQLTVPASAARSQDVTADSIKGFVESFLGQFMTAGDARPILRVGALPLQWPDIQIPAGSAVAGSVEFSYASYVVLGSPDVAATAPILRTNLEAAGWVATKTPFPQDGDPPSELYCKGLGSLVVSPRPQDSVAFLVFTPGPAMSLCDQPPLQISELGPFTLPSIPPPPDSEYMGGNSGMGERDQYFVAHLVTGRAMVEIAEHYGAGLEAAGAELERTLTADHTALKSFRIRGGDGREWAGTLTVWRGPDPNTQHVQIAIAR